MYEEASTPFSNCLICPVDSLERDRERERGIERLEKETLLRQSKAAKQ